VKAGWGNKGSLLKKKIAEYINTLRGQNAGFFPVNRAVRTFSTSF